MPVPIPDSAPPTPESDSDSLPAADVEDEEALDEEVGVYNESIPALGIEYLISGISQPAEFRSSFE